MVKGINAQFQAKINHFFHRPHPGSTGILPSPKAINSRGNFGTGITQINFFHDSRIKNLAAGMLVSKINQKAILPVLNIQCIMESLTLPKVRIMLQIFPLSYSSFKFY
jgi:hypothetical protein